MTTIDTIDSLDTLPLSQKMEIWQKLFASVMTDKDNLDGPTRLRLSQTGQCQRRLHYIHSRETPSDPTNLTRRHKLAMGHALEVLAILAFKSYGWETRHTCVDDGGQITLEMQIPGLDDPVQGHPDGICRHENFTENAWIPLECKSTSEFRAAMFEELGIAKVEPSYIMQIAMYGRLMFERGIVDHADRGVFAFISREGRLLPPERIKWNPNLSDRGVLRLAHAFHTTDEGQPPDRPYDDPNEEPCSYCPFRKICWSDRLLDELRPIVRGAATPWTTTKKPSKPQPNGCRPSRPSTRPRLSSSPSSSPTPTPRSAPQASRPNTSVPATPAATTCTSSAATSPARYSAATKTPTPISVFSGCIPSDPAPFSNTPAASNMP